MEEKNKKNAVPQQQEQKKLTYEQLEALAGNLSEQAKKLHERLMSQNYQNVITRLELLFNVLKYKDLFNEDFVGKCVSEIEGTLTIPEKEEAQTQE